MIGQVTSTVDVLQKRMDSEREKRTKADEQLSILQKKVTSLTAAMEQKADTSTVEKVSKTMGMIQSTIRSEKELRVGREKEVQIVKEKHQVHHIHHVVQVESEEKILKVSAQVTDLEEAASSDLAKLRADLKAANGKLAADEAARRESDAELKLLQEETMELFKKVASNSEKVAVLDATLTEKIDAL